jgi:hypothetical protein
VRHDHASWQSLPLTHLSESFAPPSTKATIPAAARQECGMADSNDPQAVAATHCRPGDRPGGDESHPKILSNRKIVLAVS